LYLLARAAVHRAVERLKLYGKLDDAAFRKLIRLRISIPQERNTLETGTIDRRVDFPVARALMRAYLSCVRGSAVSPSDGSPSKHCATLDLSRRLRMSGRVPFSFDPDAAPASSGAMSGAVCGHARSIHRRGASTGPRAQAQGEP
jgi:hypothetical protein